MTTATYLPTILLLQDKLLLLRPHPPTTTTATTATTDATLTTTTATTTPTYLPDYPTLAHTLYCTLPVIPTCRIFKNSLTEEFNKVIIVEFLLVFEMLLTYTEARNIH